MARVGFFDLSNRSASLDARRDPLVEIDAAVPWEEFRPSLEGVWRKPDGERKSRAGRKPMDAVLMFKALVLSALYNLSDDQIEYQVRDRLSFMRFLGLGLEDTREEDATIKNGDVPEETVGRTGRTNPPNAARKTWTRAGPGSMGNRTTDTRTT